MGQINPKHGMSTLVMHVAEGENSLHAHVTPIYQTSTFSFPDVATGAAIFKGEQPGFVYTRIGNPNLEQLAEKIAMLEGLDLLRANPDKPSEEVVDGHVFASGMAAVCAAILARVKGGQTIIAQEALYSATFGFLHDMAPRYGINVVWISDPTIENWQRAFRLNPEAVLAYAESPANPTMSLVDLRKLSELAHEHNAWVMVDNTFATPYCQRPLSLGVDVVIHSTTKYLSGHGLIVGGAVVSSHVDYVRGPLFTMLKVLGGNPSPFDAWLTNIGLKTFDLRMERHCDNTLKVARWLEKHPKVERVFFPGLSSHPQHELAKEQMLSFGGMIAFELKGGLAAGEAMMNKVKIATLAVSLGNVDTLIQHPASMTHASMARADRLRAGITDGLVRLSVGIENVEDILQDLDNALKS
ncbi:MAG TPA: aminotransferase class I/II-fold pyridoxal phosphate-dependent enzyme [Anaerolineaceae bacterium]|nr:aminotransferase class I/II-fold pyridoxal phosphate-dependent enzyme [Anaerolineaceae bacterium]